MPFAQYLAPAALIPALALAPLAEAGGRYHEARVVHVQPQYETVSYTVPTEQCRLEEVPVYYDDYRSARRGSGAGPLLGAIIGGAVGNAVTQGRKDKQLGTAVGAVIGAGIGANAHRRHAPASVSYRTERVCETVDQVHQEERVTAYRVKYRYAGETYVTVMDRDPGRFLRVRVDVTPV